MGLLIEIKVNDSFIRSFVPENLAPCRQALIDHCIPMICNDRNAKVRKYVEIFVYLVTVVYMLYIDDTPSNHLKHKNKKLSILDFDEGSD